jgi:hypothetical protein
MRQSVVPTATVSSAWTRISSSVPATGEGTSASTLSVEISTRMSSTAMGSPTCLRHSRTVPSATESPISGKATSTTSEGAAAAGSPPTSISPNGAPTWTVASASTRIFTSVPVAGEGTSASTLSVDTSTRGSSAVTVSPTCLSHSSTVPSVTDSPMAGIVISTVVVCVAIPALQLYIGDFAV